MIITTDDGSCGKKGYTTDVLEELLSEKRKKFAKSKFFPNLTVYTCGPEMMMKRVFEICSEYKVECEASLERYMACGFGVCGKCMINDKIVCIDGPIFNSKELMKLSEFGNFARLKSGRKVMIKGRHTKTSLIQTE